MEVETQGAETRTLQRNQRMNSSTPHNTQTPKKENLRIMTINCRRIFDKKAEFAAVTDYVKPDLVCATESWLSGVEPGN